ncbi:MAG: LEA type 2 family protein [Flavipsychrobacter sp.]
MMRIVYSILIVAALGMVMSCGNPKDLEYVDVKGMSIKEISMTPLVELEIAFYNPNKHGMTMKDADMDLYINDKKVGHAELMKSYDVPALDTFILPVRLNADMKAVLPNTLALLLNKEVDVELKGTVKAGRGVYIPIPIRYKGKQKLDIGF